MKKDEKRSGEADLDLSRMRVAMASLRRPAVVKRVTLPQRATLAFGGVFDSTLLSSGGVARAEDKI